MPGPRPVPSAVKIPKELFATTTGTILPRDPFTVTCKDPAPSGAFDGMMALICEGLT
jgi:hypothetical protein